MLVGCPLVSVLCPYTRGERSFLGLTSLVGLGRGRGIADTVGVCGQCLLWPRPEGHHHSLRQTMYFPRGVGLALWVPQQS